MLYLQEHITTCATSTLPCTPFFLTFLQHLSSRQFLQCETVILLREMHPNVAGDGKAQNKEVVCLCVPNSPTATEAAWLCAEQCKAAGLCVLPLPLPAVLPQTRDAAFGKMETKYPCSSARTGLIWSSNPGFCCLGNALH